MIFNIPYWDFFKIQYFANITEREGIGWKEAQGQGYFLDNSIINQSSYCILEHMLKDKLYCVESFPLA
jgi:hypothetical protein